MAAVVGIGIGLIGSASSAAGSKRQGKQLRAIGNFNAGVADQQAADAITRGHEAEDQLKSGVRKLVGSQRAGFAAQGVSLSDTGSATEVQADTYTMQDADINRIRVNAAREAWGYKVQAESYRKGGKAQAQQGNATATGTILGGLGNAFTDYNRVKTYQSSQPKTNTEGIK